MSEIIKNRPNYTLIDLIKYFLNLGTTGFGGRFLREDL